jgi:hypothetical protein
MKRTFFLILMVLPFIMFSCALPVEESGANRPPAANAGTDKFAAPGTVVGLDGSGSSDPDGDPLSFNWEIIKSPVGVPVPVITGSASKTASFTPETLGEYTVRLIVSDSLVASTSTVKITVTYGVDESVRILLSTVVDGQLNASINQNIAFEFSVPMDWTSFEGAVTIKTSSSEIFYPLTASPIQGYNYLFIDVPAELKDTVTGKLLPGETYTLRIPRTVRTAAGLELPEDLVYTFTTFLYGFEFDDSAVLSGETWGLAYHAPTNSLYYSGDDVSYNIMVRRHVLGSGVGSTVLPDASNQVMYGGLKIYGNDLYVSESYDSEVTAYPIQGDGSLSLGGASTLSATTLGDPPYTLSEVLDTVRIGSDLYFSTANYHGGDAFQDIIKYDGTGWEVAISASLHGFDNDEAKNITAINVGGIDYIILVEGYSGKIFKFLAADGSLVTSIETGNSFGDAELESDGAGNIYLGTGSGIFKYSSGLVLLDERPGLDAQRIAVKEEGGGTVTVYFVSYRQPAKISYVVF